MIFITRCSVCNHLNGQVNGEVVRSNVVCNCRCHDIPEGRTDALIRAQGDTSNDEHMAEYKQAKERFENWPR